MGWHNEVFSEEGWFEKLRQKKIERGDICGGCGEWPEFCYCKGCTCCNASMEGWGCSAVTNNLSYCYPECCQPEESGTMDGGEHEESDG